MLKVMSETIGGYCTKWYNDYFLDDEGKKEVTNIKASVILGEL